VCEYASSEANVSEIQQSADKCVRLVEQEFCQVLRKDKREKVVRKVAAIIAALHKDGPDGK